MKKASGVNIGRLALMLAGVLLLAGCDTLAWKYRQAQQSIADRISPDRDRPTHVGPEEAIMLDREPAGRESAPAEPADPSVWLVRATGYAPISLQPGATPQQKMLNAMRASKLRAYQELAAIVHGQYLAGRSRVSDMVLQDDRFDAAVAGIIRGARVVKSYPVQDDTYATILELDMRLVERAFTDMR